MFDQHELDRMTESVNNAIGNIAESVEAVTPRVHYNEFVEKLLPILQTPFDPDAQKQYRRLVSNASQKIIVVNDKNEVVYTIPSLMHGTDLFRRNKPLGNFVENARKTIDRNPMAAGRLSRQAQALVEESERDYIENVIKPILYILDDFDMSMTVPTKDGVLILTAKDTKGDRLSQLTTTQQDDGDGLDTID